MSAPVESEAIRALLAAGCLRADPLGWILDSGESFAVWSALTGIVGLAGDDPRVQAARSAVVADERVRTLIAELPSGAALLAAGHHSPQFLPNRLKLLADMGMRLGDSEHLDAVLGELAERLDSRGRFSAGGTGGASQGARCDAAAVIEVLLRFGYGDEAPVAKAVARLKSGVSATAQGRAWTCTADKRSLIAALSTPADSCPQITLEGLRVLALAGGATPDIEQVARAPIRLWTGRAEERPHEFGHGYQFKTIKWPSFWYDALAVVDTLGRFPQLWTAEHLQDRRAVVELAACLIAYNLDDTGRVTPKRVHRDYEAFSFGNKSAPSPLATAQLLTALARVSSLASEIAAVDVAALPSSRGGSGRAVQPERAAAPSALGCAPPIRRAYKSHRILPRVLARHHLDTPWEQQTPESIAADIVGLPAGSSALPYLSLAARIPLFDPKTLDAALYARHSLVRIRCMRGQLYAVRRDFVPIVHAASARQVVRHARAFVQQRGITPAEYEQLSANVLAQVTESPLTLRQLRERIRPAADLGAVLTLMTAERVLISGARADGRFGHQKTYLPLAQALPDVDLGAYSEDEARMRLLRAYVRGFGPVTRQDAAWWTGMDLKRVRRAFEALEDELVEVTFDEADEAWLMHAADAEELEWAAMRDAPVVALLPANDPLMTGYADRSRFIDDQARPYVFDKVGNTAPVVLVNGRVVAVWDFSGEPPDSHAATPASIRIFPLAPIDAAAAEKIGARAADMMRVRHAPEALRAVTYVVGMRPLASRPVGAFRHPLS